MRNSLTDLLLTEEDFTPKYQIYCDMDGVLTNFEDRFVSLLKKEGPKYYSREVISQVTRPKHFEKIEGSEEFWTFIDQHIGLVFWSEMDWMPEGKRLWDFIAEYSPKLLTSPSENNESRLGKRLWVKENINPQPEIIFRRAHEKQEFSNENSILIDDKPSNISEWKAKGGIAIECKDGDVTSVIEQLKELGYGKRKPA